MSQRLKIFETSQGLMWMLMILGVLSLTILLIILVTSLIYKPPNNPDILKYFNEDFLLRAAQYNRLGMIFSVILKMLVWLLMAAAVWVIWKYFSRAGYMKIYIVAGYIILFYLILNIIILPLSFHRGYTIEHQFGLSNQTPGMWFADFAKERSIDLIISTAAFTGLYALMVYIPKYWWLIAASVMAIFIIIGVYLYPILIDPLFFRFKTLEDPVMRVEILEVTDKAGIKVKDILVADASRKTVKANAYFTGFGNTRRIVLYDNLLNNFSKEEAINVIAHEVAHWKFAHILKIIGISITGGFIGFFILGIILSRSGQRGSIESIFIIILLISFITFLSTPLQNTLSRYFERQSDDLALEITGKYNTQIKLMKGLAEANLSNVEPHPVVRAMVYSHPPIMERIRSAEMMRE